MLRERVCEDDDIVLWLLKSFKKNINVVGCISDGLLFCNEICGEGAARIEDFFLVSIWEMHSSTIAGVNCPFKG